MATNKRAKEDITQWTNESLNRWSSKISTLSLDEHPDRYSHGYWHVSYSILGEFDRPNLRKLLEILRKEQGRETGWPVWLVHNPKPFRNSIECWLTPDKFPDGAHSDYWRASPDGHFFLLRGYQEDSETGGDPEPGTIFDFILPVWRMGECLLHAERLAKALNVRSGSVLFRATWRGLMNRRLTSWAQRGLFSTVKGVSNQYHVTSELTIPIGDISTKLSEIIRELTDPLYMIFDFFELPLQTIEKQIMKLRGKA